MLTRDEAVSCVDEWLLKVQDISRTGESVIKDLENAEIYPTGSYEHPDYTEYKADLVLGEEVCLSVYYYVNRGIREDDFREMAWMPSHYEVYVEDDL